MPVSPPIWYNPPLARWIKCRVESELSPQGYLVELEIEDEQRSIVAPYGSVKPPTTIPGDGELFVVVVAELPGDTRVLTELPATPFRGSQRLKVHPDILQEVA